MGLNHIRVNWLLVSIQYCVFRYSSSIRAGGLIADDKGLPQENMRGSHSFVIVLLVVSLMCCSDFSNVKCVLAE